MRERAAARWLQENDGADPETVHIATSTGRVGHHTHLQYDTSSTHYKAEVKCSRACMTSGQGEAWLQINQIADKAGHEYAPLLVLYAPEGARFQRYAREGHSVLLPPIHGLTPTRHADLLESEREHGMLFDFVQALELWESYLDHRDGVLQTEEEVHVPD